MKITNKIEETYKLVDNVKEKIGELSKELNQLNNLQQSTTYDQIRKSLGLAGITGVSAAVTILEKYELIVKIKEDRITKVDFNIEGVNEIVKLSHQREKSNKIIDELFGD